MAKTIRSAIIGIGKSTPGKGGGHSFSYCHGWAYAATPGFELVAACSRSEQNVADFVKEFPACKGFQDYRKMLAEAKPELVNVCAFAPDREEMVMAAIGNGAKAVWIEKPFALTLAAAKRMMEAADKSGVRLFVNHQRRYGKPFEWFRDATGKIGEVQGVDITQPFSNVLNFGSHLVDTALFALGPKRKAVMVFGTVDWSNKKNWQGLEHESQLMGAVHFDDGTRLTIEAGNHVCKKLPVLRLNGSLGFAELHLSPASDAKSIFRAKFANESGISSPATDEHFHHSADLALYMKRAAADVRDAINNGSPTLIDAAEAYRGLEIMLGIFESAKQGRILVLPLAI